MEFGDFEQFYDGGKSLIYSRVYCQCSIGNTAVSASHPFNLSYTIATWKSIPLVHRAFIIQTRNIRLH